MTQWIGVAVAVLGMFAYRQIPNTQPPQPVQHPAQFAYTTINIAYDVNNGRYYFQHHDGLWYDHPPKP
jgi:hypothetical protein